MITSIYAVWVYVRDVQKSRMFYEKVLGLKVKLINGSWIEYDLGATSFAILERSKEKGPVKPQKAMIMLQVDDIEEMKKLLLAHQVKLIGDIRSEEYGKLLTFEDPDGHWLELFEPESL